MAFYPKNNDTCFCNKRPVLISEAPRAYFGTPVRADLKSARREYRDLQSRNAFFRITNAYH